jgi:hypothetical protein
MLATSVIFIGMVLAFSISMMPLAMAPGPQSMGIDSGVMDMSLA